MAKKKAKKTPRASGPDWDQIRAEVITGLTRLRQRRQMRDWWARYGYFLRELPIEEIEAMAAYLSRGDSLGAAVELARGMKGADFDEWQSETTEAIADLADKRQRLADGLRELAEALAEILGRVLLAKIGL